MSALFAALIFTLFMTTAEVQYFAVDDPQLLGHALQTTGLVVLLGGTGLRRVVLAAVLMAASLMTKHILVALPVAVTLALLIGDRRGFAQWTMAGTTLGAPPWRGPRSSSSASSYRGSITT